MFKQFRFRLSLAQFSSRLTDWFQQFRAAVKPVLAPSLLRVSTQTLVVGVLATVLWLGSVGAYTQAAQAGDNLDARPYEAEAVRQSRSPASRENPTNGVDQLHGVTSKAPEDVANEALESAKDAVKDALPGMSADRGVGQNAYNPNTQHSSNPKR
jgi:hypothetical protein